MSLKIIKSQLIIINSHLIVLIPILTEFNKIPFKSHYLSTNHMPPAQNPDYRSNHLAPLEQQHFQCDIEEGYSLKGEREATIDNSIGMKDDSLR